MVALSKYRKKVMLTHEQEWVESIMNELELQYSYKLLNDRRRNTLGFYTRSYLNLEKEIERGAANPKMREAYKGIRDQVPEMFCLFDYCKLRPLIEAIFKPNVFTRPIINVERTRWGIEGLFEMHREPTRDTGTQSPEVITID